MRYTAGPERRARGLLDLISSLHGAALDVTGALGGAPDQPHLFQARQMQALSLGVHIPLVCFGIAFPAIVLFTEGLWLRTGDPVYRALAKRWSKVMIILFAIGVVTGTILSFEFGLLWPNFMATFGDVFGVAFGLEGISFFIEAIFIAIYVYGWDRLSRRAHFLVGIPIVITGMAGSLFVIAVNGWMNNPQGFDLVNGRVVNVRPWEALFNGNLWHELLHMYMAGYIVVGFIVASVYAWSWLRGTRDRYHRVGLIIPLTVACLAAPVQVIFGDWAGRTVAQNQPVKLAAMEGLGRTTAGAPFHFLGWYSNGRVQDGIEIPDLLSILAFHDPHATVKGLDSVPPDDRPPAVNVVRFAFQTMVVDRQRLRPAGLLVPDRLVAQAPAAAHAVVLPRGGALRSALPGGADLGLDRDRGGAPALDRLFRHAHLGGGDRRRRHPGRLRRAAGHLRRAGRRRPLAAAPPGPAPA